MKSGGKIIVDKPMPEALVKVISRQCHEAIEADSAIRRFNAAHSWPVILLLDIVVSLIDPIYLVLTAIFSAITAALSLRLARKVLLPPGP
jgi:hypothetical protein